VYTGAVARLASASLRIVDDALLSQAQTPTGTAKGDCRIEGRRLTIARHPSERRVAEWIVHCAAVIVMNVVFPLTHMWLTSRSVNGLNLTCALGFDGGNDAAHERSVPSRPRAWEESAQDMVDPKSRAVRACPRRRPRLRHRRPPS